MIRSARVLWLLLLLFVLDQQRWGAGAEERTGAHPLERTGAHPLERPGAHPLERTGAHPLEPMGAHPIERRGAHSPAHTMPHIVAHTEEHDSAQRETLAQDDSTGRKLKDKTTLDQKKHQPGTDTPQQSLTLATTPEEGPNSNSSLAFPCPAAAAIAPCVCTVDDSNNIDLNCTFIESEEQLANVFSQDFPIKAMHGFYMASNSALRVLGNSHSGVSFEVIDLSPGPFTLQAISEYLLLDSRLTLITLKIHNSELISDGFPFAMLEVMDTLNGIDIYRSSFTWLPRIEAPMLTDLWLTYGSVDIIEPGTFDAVPNLSTLSLFGNSLAELRAGTVPIREVGMTFSGNFNGLEDIEPGALFFADAGSLASSGRLFLNLDNNRLQSLRAEAIPLQNSNVSLYLYHNQLTSIEPGAFVLPERTDSFSLYLSLRHNQLTTLEEPVFGDLLPFITELHVQGNPLACECDIAWLVTNEAYMAKVDPQAACADGRLLLDLDPQDYVDFC